MDTATAPARPTRIAASSPYVEFRGNTVTALEAHPLEGLVIAHIEGVGRLVVTEDRDLEAIPTPPVAARDDSYAARALTHVRNGRGEWTARACILAAGCIGRDVVNVEEIATAAGIATSTARRHLRAAGFTTAGPTALRWPAAG